MKRRMIKNRKAAAVLGMLLTLVFVLGGCGRDDDKLVMVTTEKNADTETETATGTNGKASETSAEKGSEVRTEEQTVIEEATPEEKTITLQQIYEANTGDKLLAGKKGYGINRIYYLNGTENASEYEYMGFDDEGNYIQVYEDDKGYVQILDNYNAYWYVFTGSANDNTLLTLIYPEDGLVSYLIEYTHLNMVYAYSEENQETIQDIYREDGELTVETKYEDEDGEEYKIKYIIDENLVIKAYTLYYPDGSKGVYVWTTPDVEYPMPDFVTEMRDNTERRTVTIVYPNAEGQGGTYEVSADYPIDIRLTEYQAYLDEDCQMVWTPALPDENGKYPDEMIYLAK